LPERFLTEIRRQSFGFIFQQFNLIKGCRHWKTSSCPASRPADRGPNCSHRAEQLACPTQA
jgi:putative ABC transport system ATP-binding protein